MSKAPVFQPAVEGYLARLAVTGEPLPAVFEAMHGEASRRNFPIVGPEVGRFFRQLAQLRRPARILELGSGFGYSAIWWALGCPDAEIHLTEFKQANLDQAAAFASEAGVSAQLHYHAGDALEIARGLSGPWDIIFCDIDKQAYPAALDFAEEVLRRGDVLLFDNMLWDGRVAQPPETHDAATAAVIETTRRLYGSRDWCTSLLPVRDGVMMAVRQ